MIKSMLMRLWMLAGGVLLFAFMELKVQAARLPEFSELSLKGEPGGICGQTIYIWQEEETEYVVYLYVQECTPQGNNVKERMEIFPSAEGTGNACTGALAVEEGTYTAAAVVFLRNDPTGQVIYYKESERYRVTQTEGGYEVVPAAEMISEEVLPTYSEAPKEQEEKEAKVQAPAYGGCAHQLQWQQISEADADKDALAASQCLWCGEVFEYREVSNSAYETFLREAKMVILGAPLNSTVTLLTRRWVSFNREVMEALESRRDLTVSICYFYQGTVYEVTVPPDVSCAELLNEEGFCGFRYLDQIFGGKRWEF